MSAPHRALRVLLLCGAHHVLVTPSSLSARGTEGSKCPPGDRSSCGVRSSAGPSRAADHPAPRSAARAHGRPLRSGRTRRQPRGGRTGGRARRRSARRPFTRQLRGPRPALSGRARREHGARRGLGPAARRGGGRSAEPAADYDPAACGRCPRASPSGPRPLPTRALRPPPRRPVPNKVVDETWLTPMLESLVCRRRRSPWCGGCLRATSSPSAILYRFKINSPLTSNAAAALSTSREPAGRRRVLAPPSACSAQASPRPPLCRPSAPVLRLHPAGLPLGFPGLSLWEESECAPTPTPPSHTAPP